MSKWVKALFILGFAVILNSLSISAAEYGRHIDGAKTLPRVAVDINLEQHHGVIQSPPQFIAVEATGDPTPTADLRSEVDNNNTATTTNHDELTNKTDVVTNNTSPQINEGSKKPSNTNPNKSTSKESTSSPEKIDSINISPTKPLSREISTNRITLETVLAEIAQWWIATPLAQQIWYIILLTGLVLYILKLKQLRRPLLFASIMLLGFYLGSSLDPIGAIFSLIPIRNFSFDGAIILLGVIVLVSLIFGRIYCGWVCPIGAIQEFIYPELKRQVLPATLDTLLKYLKFIILIVLLYFFWRIGNNLWESYEPFKTLVHFGGSTMAVFVLILTLIVSVLIERPFCRYICPLGAIVSLTARIAPFRMRADANRCMVCGKCSTSDCSMNAIHTVNPVTDLPQIDGSECISCLRCQRNCQRSALRISFKRIDHIKNI